MRKRPPEISDGIAVRQLLQKIQPLPLRVNKTAKIYHTAPDM